MSELGKGLTNMAEERGKTWRKHGQKGEKLQMRKKDGSIIFFKSKQIRLIYEKE